MNSADAVQPRFALLGLAPLGARAMQVGGEPPLIASDQHQQSITIVAWVSSHLTSFWDPDPSQAVITKGDLSMRNLLAVTLALLALSASPALCEEVDHTMVNADEVQWKEAPPILRGAQAAILYGDPTKEGVFVMRLKFPANYRVPPHTHPVDEIVTVISGEFNIGMGREFDQAKTKPYAAGGLIAMPPGTEHFVYTDQETVIQISTKGPWALNFVNPNDKAGVTE